MLKETGICIFPTLRHNQDISQIFYRIPESLDSELTF